MKEEIYTIIFIIIKLNISNTEILKEQDAEYKLNLNNIHDKTFRKILDDKSEVVVFLNKYLNLKEKLTIEEIEKYNSSFLSNNLRNQESDIIYKIKDRDVFFLIEHQSKIDYSMLIRILEYEMDIIKSAIDNRKIKNKDYKVPLVIPIVLYTGNRKWNAKIHIKEAQEHFDEYKGLELANYMLVDVNNFSKEELLQETNFISKAMLMEKAKNSEELVKYLEDIVKEITRDSKIYTKNQKELLITILDLGLRKKIGNDKTEDFIKKLIGGERNMLAVLDMIEKENKKLINRGRKQGIEQGTRKIAKEMKKNNLPVELIAKITGLKEEEVLKLK